MTELDVRGVVPVQGASLLPDVPIPATPVFDSEERESLETNAYVHPYSAITKAQLTGLLFALGK
jgi:hypothetical protein